MSRRWFLIIPLLLVLFLLFQNWIVFKTVEWSLQNTLTESFSGDVKWESIERKGSTVIVRSPKVVQGETTNFSAETLILHWDFQLLSRNLTLDLEAHKPEILLSSSKINLCKDENEKGFSRFLNIKGALKVVDGKLFYSLGEADVNLDINFLLDKTLNLSLRQGDSLFDFNAQDIGEEVEGRLQATKFPLPLFSEMAAALCPTIIKERFSKGLIDGNFAFRVTKGFRPQIEGDLTLQDLVFIGADTAFEMAADSIAIDLKPTEPTAQNQDFPWLPTLKGQIKVIEGGKIAVSKGGSRPFVANSIIGELRFQGIEKAEFLGEGWEEYRGEQGQFSLYGSLDYRNFENMAVELEYQGNKNKENSTHLVLDGFSIGGSRSLVHFDLKNFGIQQFSLLEAVLKKVAPGVNPVDFYDGRVDASISVNFVDSKVSNLSIENIALRNLDCSAKTLECDFGAQNVSGFVKMDLSDPKPTETVEAELLIVNGELKLNTLPEDLWKFTNIQTKLVIQKGVVQKSIASVNLAGLTGDAEMNWQSLNSPLKMHFEGKAVELAKFMPERVESGIMRRSIEDDVTLDLQMKREGRNMVFNGDLAVHDPLAGTKNKFNFGFDLKPPHPDDELAGQQFYFWFDVAPSWLSPLMAPYAGGIAESLIARKQSEIGIFGYRLTGGWLESKGVPLQKFVSSYIFKKDDIVLSGSADIKGSFDLKGIEIFYSTQDMVLESGKLRMEMKKTPDSEAIALTGNHRADFSTGEHRGTLPLEHASYYDKIKGLYFSEMKGEALFHNKKVFLPSLETNVNGVFLKGDLLVDNTDPREGAFDVFVDIDILDGTLEAVNHSLERIDPEFFLLKAPLNGQVQLKESGAKLAFYLLPGDFTWDAKVAGNLIEGTLDFGILSLSSKGVNLSFDYDKKSDKLSIQDFGGTFFLGEEGQEEEIHYLIDTIAFENLGKKEGEFNFRLFDKQGDLFSIAGETLAKDEHVQFLFEPNKTHFGQIIPGKVELETEGLSRVKHFALDLDLDLTSLTAGIKRVGKANLLISPETANALKDASGILKCRLSYNEEDSKLKFEVKGQKVSIEGHEFEKVHLSGDVLDGIIRVQDGIADQLIFSFDLTKDKGDWHLGHLALNVGESLIMGLEGTWVEGSPTFDAKVNLAEVHLDKIGEFDVLKPFVEEFDPKGVLKGSGTLIFDKNDPNFGIKASLTTNFDELELKNLLFREMAPATLQFEWGKGIEFKNIQTALVDKISKNDLVKLSIQDMGIDFAQDKTHVKDLHYSLATSELPWLADQLQNTFPEMVTPFVYESIRTIKKEGLAAGTLDLIIDGTETKVAASLADGEWHLMGWDGVVKQFRLDMDSEEVKVSTQYLLDNQFVWVLARTPRPDFNSGVVLVADGTSEETPITIQWSKRPNSGVVINKIEGNALGLKLNLVEDPENKSSLNTLRMKGEAGIDMSRASILLSPELKEKVQALGLGTGWGLRGVMEVQKESVDDKRPYFFKGELHGQNFEVKGLKFDRLFGYIQATEKIVHMQDLVVEDLAGTLSVKEGAFEQMNHGAWSVNIPLLVGYDIRPSLLWEAGKNRSREIKPLIIKEMQIQDLYGPLSPLAELTGKGYLNFVNPVKKNLHNTIFAIPAEILSRIGIDMIALTPVTGTITFDIMEEKVFFTKFKDVNSDGKLSKFYLADSKEPSYMDFDGTLHLQVKMKQYTLLFKLAELFTFDIKGNISKPVYSIHKGNK